MAPGLCLRRAKRPLPAANWEARECSSRRHLNFALRGSKFKSTVQPVCSDNVVDMPDVPSSFRKLLEMRHNSKFDRRVDLANEISNSN